MRNSAREAELSSRSLIDIVLPVEEEFKRCPVCCRTWDSLESFLADKSLQLNGYQVSFKTLESGLFLFTHHVKGCYTTLSLCVADFRSLYSGVAYAENKAFSGDCPRHCMDEKQLARCDKACSCAFVREIIQVIREKQIT